MTKMRATAFLGAAFLMACATQSSAQSRPTLGLHGNVGLIDMPTAESLPDAEITGSYVYTSSATLITLGFQFTNRLSATFRYADLTDWTINGNDEDRSYDIQFRLFDETDYVPAIAVGLRDFMGNGAFSSEYLVATKNFNYGLKVTAGIGWGRLSDSSKLRFGDNPQGGVPTVDQWFSGPSGFFGGIEWTAPIEGLTLKAEYSSDEYTREVAAGAVTRDSPFNFGLEYRGKRGLSYGLYYLNGNELAFRFTAAINPKNPPSTGSMERAPIPVMARPINQSRSTGWTQTAGFNKTTRAQFSQLLEDQGLKIEALALSGTSAELRLLNPTYNASAQAIGRAARVMAAVLPGSVETFVITPVVDGLAASSVTLKRSDLERYEHDAEGTEAMLQHAVVSGAAPLPDNAEIEDGIYPKLTWALAPYMSISLFDGGGALTADVGFRGSARYQLSNGLSFSGSVTQRVFGNQEDEVPPPSGLPRVRSDRALYRQEGGTAIERLTGDYMFKPSTDWYGRVSVGYLETMFGGISGEVLWKPAASDWGVGVEVNYVAQRDFDQKLGFQDYEVATGHISAYWQVTEGTTAQLDIGRYLAGDWGATLSVDRVFANGWRMGAYATLTDADYADYGDGSFTKGFRLSVPLSWGVGTPHRKSYAIDMNTVARDGGARLDIDNRLFEVVSEYHRPGLETGWARFWR